MNAQNRSEDTQIEGTLQPLTSANVSQDTLGINDTEKPPSGAQGSARVFPNTQNPSLVSEVPLQSPTRNSIPNNSQNTDTEVDSQVSTQVNTQLDTQQNIQQENVSDIPEPMESNLNEPDESEVSVHAGPAYGEPVILTDQEALAIDRELFKED